MYNSYDNSGGYGGGYGGDYYNDYNDRRGDYDYRDGNSYDNYGSSRDDYYRGQDRRDYSPHDRRDDYYQPRDYDGIAYDRGYDRRDDRRYSRDEWDQPRGDSRYDSRYDDQRGGGSYPRGDAQAYNYGPTYDQLRGPAPEPKKKKGGFLSAFSKKKQPPPGPPHGMGMAPAYGGGGYPPQQAPYPHPDGARRGSHGGGRSGSRGRRRAPSPEPVGPVKDYTLYDSEFTVKGRPDRISICGQARCPRTTKATQLLKRLAELHPDQVEMGEVKILPQGSFQDYVRIRKEVLMIPDVGRVQSPLVTVNGEYVGGLMDFYNFVQARNLDTTA